MRCPPGASDASIGPTILTHRSRRPIDRATVARVRTLDGTAIAARRARNDRWCLSPSVVARSAEERRQRHSAMRDDHFGSSATWARMVDGDRATRVSTTPRLLVGLVRLKPNIAGATLMWRPFADDSTIGRRASHVDLQDTAILQREIQDLAVLGVRR